MTTFSKIKLPLILLFSLFLFFPAVSQKKNITTEDIWASGTFRPQYLYGLNWMKNSQYYTALDFDPLTRSINIVKYDIKTGEPVETLLKGVDLQKKSGEKNFLIEEYSFNEDETQVLLAVNQESIYRRSSRADYYLCDLSSGKLRKVDQEKIMHPTFSPDGKNLAYVRDNNLFVASLADLTSQPITTDGEKNKIINGNADWVYEEEFEFSKAFFWSPDSRKIAFYRFDESRVKDYNMQLWKGLYPTDYVYKYPVAGERNSVVSIHVYDLSSGKTQKMETGKDPDSYFPRVQWTQDPNLLSIQYLNRLQNHFQILHADAQSGKTQLAYEEKNQTYIEITNNLKYLSDGKHFVLTSEKDGFRHLYLYDLNGKEVRQITKGKWELLDLVGVDSESGTVYYTSTEASPLEKHLYSIALSGKNTIRITHEKGFHEIDVAPDLKYYIDYFSTVNVPYKIGVFSLPEGNAVRNVISNKELQEKMKAYAMGQVEFFKFKTTEKVTLNGWMLKPPGFDPSKKYPVLMTVYGGPGHQAVLNQWGGHNFFWYQMLAEQGYIVVSIDNRGTGGRGVDFKKITYGQLGKFETMDLIESAKYLQGLSYVDTNRIGIFGWSFGGYLSSLAITVGNAYFKMAIAVAPVTNWRFYDTIYTERYLGLPQDNPEGYDENSPLAHAAELKGKYLLIHGTADDNVHMLNSLFMQQALIAAEKQFDVFYYPNKNHSIYGGNTRLHLYTMMTDYILGNL